MSSSTKNGRQFLPTTSTTPTRQQAYKHPETPRSQKKRLVGRYSDDHWWCNCKPRKKASLRETRKEGPNKGKFYYKCDDCAFFFWWDEAKIRESVLKPKSPTGNLKDTPKPKIPSLTQQSLVAYGYQVTPGVFNTSDESSSYLSETSSDSDSESVPGTGSGSGSGKDSNVVIKNKAPASDLVTKDAHKPTPSRCTSASLAPSTQVTETPSRGSSKRKWDTFEDDNDDEFGDIASDEERQMVMLADQSASKMSARKSLTTPSNPRSVDIVNGLPTPSIARTLFPSSTKKRQKQVTFEDAPIHHEVKLSPTASLPATTRPGASSVTCTASSISLPETSYDVTDEVMKLLQDQGLDTAVLRSVQNVLSTTARRVQGVVLSRDRARVTVDQRDKRIAVLEERVAVLENKDDLHRQRFTNIKAGLMKMYEEN